MQVALAGLAVLVFTYLSSVLVPATVRLNSRADPEGWLFLMILATPTVLSACASWAWLFETSSRVVPAKSLAIRRVLRSGGTLSMAALLVLSWGLALYGFWLSWVETAWRVGLLILVPAVGLVLFEGWIFNRLYPPSRRARRLHPVGALGGVALTLAGVMAIGLALWIDHQTMASVAALLVAPDYGWRVFGMYYAGGIGLAAGYMTLAASCDWWPLRSSRQL